MTEILAVRRWSIRILTAAMLFGSADYAGAQGFISPFIGYNFGGDAGCPQITNCQDKHANYGVGVGALGSLVGFEAEVAHTNDFLGQSPTESTDVLTFMANFMIAPKVGPVQPYGLGGVGLMRTSIQGSGQSNDENQLGWDLGGGLIGYFSQHVGIRGDVRYFHSFQVLDLARFPSLMIQDTKLDFGRVSIAAVFKF